MYNNKINLIYRKEMVSELKVGSSKSPNKPEYLLDFLTRNKLNIHFNLFEEWEAFTAEDFYLAHTKKYVDSFFAGKEPLASSNGLNWNPQFADSVRYTNASLYQAIEQSILYPEVIQFSPTSGFHHANPNSGVCILFFLGSSHCFCKNMESIQVKRSLYRPRRTFRKLHRRFKRIHQRIEGNYSLQYKSLWCSRCLFGKSSSRFDASC